MPIQRKQISPQTALQRLQALCARSEQCSPDLLRKLSSWGISQSDAGKIMDSLFRLRFCDDNRFAQAFARDKALGNRWGRRKIAAALFAKRLPSQIINDALDTLDPEEYFASLLYVAKVKSARINLDDYDMRTKLYRHLASRGYESNLISQAIRQIITIRRADNVPDE